MVLLVQLDLEALQVLLALMLLVQLALLAAQQDLME
jgi:hypothetical protein